MKKKGSHKYIVSEIEFTIIGECQVQNCINPDESNRKDIKFNVICKCGKPRIVSLYYLNRCQKVLCKQCGWEKVGKTKEKKDSGFNALVWHYVKAAQRRNIDYSLTTEQVKTITSKNCNYCGNPPSLLAQPKKGLNGHGQYIYNTIDRVDSSKGYHFENCVPACKQCNLSKSSLTTEQFLSFIKRVYQFQEKNNVNF